ncbi:XRE family transcriptional regulator [Streptomyces formicae]|uniref:XRE family transcriptional regulator n=1 Tax=Streptomyces formicae TaxID=1616117 RepID=A0ABY3WJS5_9ACTN|nr:XRE family transcriptional regulator [Streptomyces formicae]UNM10850.1 XRE family transcriptional regulator [Streptomyces formicae]
MPRWKALPEELDPQVREFAGQLRRLVDRSGLSIAAVSDRTGYSKTSWERYLNGRLLAPKGAIVALAEVTGTNPVHLLTMWELAERAWSRSEMRHDMTMEAIRISQARAALGETGPTTAPQGGGPRTTAPPARPAAGQESAGQESAGPGRSPYVPTQRGGSWAPPPVYPASPPAYPASPGHRAAPGRGPDRGRGRRKVAVFLAGVVGALVVVAAALMLTDLGGGGSGEDPGKNVAESPAASPTAGDPQLPAGVECSGADCTGQDPENMGCGGEFAATVSKATVGTALVEVRYSRTCAAAWARITRAAPGDKVSITAGDATQSGLVNADKDAYTPMVAVASESDAQACATLTTGTKGCTTDQ